MYEFEQTNILCISEGKGAGGSVG